MKQPRLSHIAFVVSLLSFFVNLFLMNIHKIDRDGFAWFVVIASFIVMLFAAGFSTNKPKE